MNMACRRRIRHCLYRFQNAQPNAPPIHVALFKEFVGPLGGMYHGIHGTVLVDQKLGGPVYVALIGHRAVVNIDVNIFHCLICCAG